HGVILDLSIAANTSLANLAAVSSRGFLATSQERALAADYLQRLNIKADGIDAPVSSLSGGNQQKVCLGKWLATNPSVLILDEPTQGIDVGAKSEVHKLMCDLAARGMAIMMISSELPEVLGMSDRIAVMRKGAITGVLNRAGATQPRVMSLAVGGLREASSLGFDSKREWSILAALGVLLAALALAEPRFFSPENLRDLVLANVPVLMAAIGMTAVILTGEIDVSIGSQFAILSVAAGLLAKTGMSIIVLAAILAMFGLVLGAINGVLVATAGIPSIVATLATM